jgi:2-polyprenyl-3-methyl-5-hydroxy-6-metoxy-1,4-benzoquinol methylase
MKGQAAAATAKAAIAAEAAAKRLSLTRTQCCVCETDDAERVGAGVDFEYRTSEDTFSAVRCRLCGLVYLNPRPSLADLETIYPPDYHAFDFSEENFGFIHKVRSRLEAQRLLSWCRNLPDEARILDVGCGDGFHLNLLKKYGKKSWTLEGVDIDKRAAEAARAKLGLKIHLGSIEQINLAKNAYDLALMIQTIEHVENPFKILSAIQNVLKSKGRLVVVTDNTDSIDFALFKGGYWGGYHFPRHWNLFNKNSLAKLAEKAGLEVESLTTAVTPVNWVYSIHNALVDLNAPRLLINRFTLRSFVSLSAFTSLDIVLQKLGRGGLLQAILQKP